MRKRLILIVALFTVFMTGCQIKDNEIEDNEISKQEQVDLLALAEINIPEEDNVEEVVEEVFVVGEGYDIWRKLNLVKKDGSFISIGEDVLDWVTINENGENLIYYHGAEVKGTEWSREDRSFNKYNIKTGNDEILYRGKSDNGIEIIRDEGSNKNYLALKTQYEEFGANGDLTLISIENDQIIFEAANIDFYRPLYIYKGVLCYQQNDGNIMSYDIEKKKISTLMDLQDLAMGYNDMYTDKEHIYIETCYEGPGYQITYDKIYKINISTGIKTEINFERMDDGNGRVEITNVNGDYIYVSSGDVYTAPSLFAYNMQNRETYNLGAFYMGQNSDYLYVYDEYQLEDEYLWENEEEYIPKTLEQLFKDPQKLYRIPKGTNKRESATLDSIRKYTKINYDGDLPYYLHINPIIKDGYETRQSADGGHALCEENQDTPFYETGWYISGFDKVDIINTNKLNVSLSAEALTLNSGHSQQLSWTISNPEATLYFTSSDPSVATVDEEGLITTHNPGTTNISITAIQDGFKRDIQNLPLTVEGTPKAFLAVKPSMVIGEPGEKVKIQYQTLGGATVDVSSPTQALEMIQSADRAIEVIVPKDGVGEIVFTVNQEGYSENKITVPIARVTDDIEKNISYLTETWESIPNSQKNLEDIRDNIASQGDIIGTELASIVRRPKKNIYVVTKEDCLALLDRTWNIKQILKGRMNKTGIIPYRDFADSIKVNLDGAKKGITIEVNRKELAGVGEELLPLILNIRELDCSSQA